MDVTELPSVAASVERLRELLHRASEIKPKPDIEPPLPITEYSGELGLSSEIENKSSQHALIEVAARQLFLQFLTNSSSVDDAEFVHMWNLLDILNILGDQEQCDPSLVWYMIEELLDSQSIDGCRRVFDYLESRRERLVTKFFKKRREMVILRCCNELLRRLSRAEDAVFCGRVFIFLFQSFPLGDRSSVNTKGEFNVENITTFEDTVSEPQASESLQDAQKPMDKPEIQIFFEDQTSSTNDEAQSGNTNSRPVLDTNALYPIFWKLQEVFSNPPLIFEAGRLDQFKTGLELSLAKFKAVPKVIQTSAPEASRGTKRKASEIENGEKFVSTFNPKYLTSRELFDLEMSDLAFQRHILVQALILIDFMLSLTEDAKKKLANITTQKALQYEFTLDKSNTEWALKMKAAIEIYLKDPADGSFYHRMVNTVLSRDKNWVRWKLENCPEIARNPISAKEFQDSMEAAKKMCAPRRINPIPMGSLDLRFLSEASKISNLDRLKEPDRVRTPDIATMIHEVEQIDLDIEMATEEEKKDLEVKRMRAVWKTFRVASKTKSSTFDKISIQNLKPLLGLEQESEGREDDLAVRPPANAPIE